MDQYLTLSSSFSKRPLENVLTARDLKKSASIFSSLPNDILLAEVRSLVRKERAIQAEFLEALREIEARKLYLEIGYGNLFDFMTKGLGYQGGSAQRRIDAVRLSQVVPEVIAKVKEGSVNLMTLSRLQSVIKTEERTKREKLQVELKKELVQEITHKTLRETDQVLFRKLPETSIKAKELRKESVRAVGPDQSRMTLLISEKLKSKIERMREVVSNKSLQPGLETILELSVDEFLKRQDPLQKAERAIQKDKIKILTSAMEVEKVGQNSGGSQQDADVDLESKSKEKAEDQEAGAADLDSAKGFTSTPEVKRTQKRIPIPARTKHLVFLRDNGRCQAKDVRTGQICGSRRHIELDHITPVAKGGSNEVRNLRCACRAHNQHFAERAFGIELMSRFRSSLPMSNSTSTLDV